MILIIFYREVFDLKDLNSSFIDNIKNYSSELKLNVIKSDILDSINEANENNLSYEEFLANLLQKEVDIKKYNLTQSRIRLANFPYKKYFSI